MMIIDEIKLAFSENKIAICLSTAIFLISLILGYIWAPYLYDFFNPVIEDLNQKIQSGAVTLTFSDVFLNNIYVVFLMFFSGALFCISALTLSFNGFLLGYYIGASDDLIQTLLLIIPHGIFESSSCILACASGFVLFNFIYKFLKIVLGHENRSIKESFPKLKQAVILLVVSSVLMFIAGIVEVYLTIPIADFIIQFLG